MTPDEALYRELFMAELWPTCREYGAPAVAERPRKSPQMRCQYCGLVYSRKYLTAHVQRVHTGAGNAQLVDSAVHKSTGREPADDQREWRGDDV